jgi:hypothetical protein
VPFQPTHTVPKGGLPIWDVPDGNRQPLHELDANLRVQVVEGRGPWARVVCDYGFEGWVDGNALVPGATAGGASAAATADLNRTLLIGGGVAAAVLLVVVALLAGGSDKGGDEAATPDSNRIELPDDDTTTTEAEQTTTTEAATTTSSRRGRGAALVDLDVPAGWSISDDGLFAAESASDLGSPNPVGPVVRASVGDAADVDFEALLAQALDTDDPDFTFTEPQQQEVDGFDAVTVVIRTGDRVQAFIAVHPPADDAVVFVLDSPVDRFNDIKDVLGAIPGIDAG